MYVCLRAKYPLFLPHFIQIRIFVENFQKIEFREHPASGSWVVPRRQTDR